jgi:SET domain-containing protein
MQARVDIVGGDCHGSRIFAMLTKPKKAPCVVRMSKTHGRGAFATRTIRKGECIIEYRGVRSSYDTACERPLTDPNDPYHTFMFELSDGRVIDAAVRGNDARWINHSCDPNCEPFEHDDFRVFIHARRTIRAGEELSYDYKLVPSGKVSKRERKAMACRCGASKCRGTMLEIKVSKPKR